MASTTNQEKVSFEELAQSNTLGNILTPSLHESSNLVP